MYAAKVSRKSHVAIGNACLNGFMVVSSEVKFNFVALIINQRY